MLNSSLVNIYSKQDVFEHPVLVAYDVPVDVLNSFSHRAAREIRTAPEGAESTLRWDLAGVTKTPVFILIKFMLNTINYAEFGKVVSIPCQSLSGAQWMALFNTAEKLEIPLASRRLTEQFEADLKERIVTVPRAVQAHNAALELGNYEAWEELGKYLGSLGEYVDLDELQMIEDSGISPDDKNLAISLAAERTFFYGTEKDDWDIQELSRPLYRKLMDLWEDLGAERRDPQE